MTDEEDQPLCGACNGSGEGMHDGTKCISCGGRGQVPNCEDEPEDRDYRTEAQDRAWEEG